jgi:hypothetical protein
VGSEIILRGDGRGEILSPNQEEAKMTPEVGIVMGFSPDGYYFVGLLKAKEVVMSLTEHVAVSLNRFQGPTQPKFVEYLT